jgi:hypothetical protein
MAKITTVTTITLQLGKFGLKYNVRPGDSLLFNDEYLVIINTLEDAKLLEEATKGSDGYTWDRAEEKDEDNYDSYEVADFVKYKFHP